MYKKICLVFCMFFLTACNQTSSASLILKELPPVVRGELDTSLPENSNLILIQQDNKFGLINLNGDIVLKPKFVDADLKNSVMIANLNNDGYIVLKNGKEIQLPFVKNQHITFDTTDYIFYYDDKNEISFVNYLDADVKTIKRSNHLENMEEIVYMNNNFFVSRQGNDADKVYSISDYAGTKVGKSYSDFYGYSSEKPRKIAFGDAGNVVVMDDRFEIESTFDGVSFDFITNENYILYKSKNEIQFIDSSGSVLNTYTDELNISTKVLKPYNFVYVETDEGLILTNIFGTTIIQRGFISIEPSTYYDKPVFICKEKVQDGKSIASIYDNNGQIIKTFKFLKDYDIVSLCDDYAAVKAFDDSSAGIIEVLNSTEKNINWMVNVEDGDIEAFMDYKNNPINNHFLITKNNADDTKFVGLYSISMKNYVFSPIYLDIKSLGNGLYDMKSIYYDGISTYSGDFRYVHELE